MKTKAWISVAILFLVGVAGVSLAVREAFQRESIVATAPAAVEVSPIPQMVLDIDDLKRRLAGREASVVPPPANCYADALETYWFGGVALMRGEDSEYVFGKVAQAVQFDVELRELWRLAQSDAEAFRLFTFLLQAKAWHGGCP